MIRLPVLLASVLLSTLFAAQAIPVTYDLTFNGSGPSTGSFIYEFLDANGTAFSGSVIARQRIAAVAEPTALALLGVGLLTLTLLVRGNARRSASAFMSRASG